MAAFRILMLGLVVCALTGCIPRPQVEMQPTATLLPSLRSLPAEGRIPCSKPAGVFVFVFESPGSLPPDPNSGGRGLNGDVLGKLSPCETFTITKVAWSTYNQEYYVYAETSDARGWVGLYLIEVIP